MCVALLKTSHFYSTLPVERLLQPIRSEKLEDVEAMRRAGHDHDHDHDVDHDHDHDHDHDVDHDHDHDHDHDS